MERLHNTGCHTTLISRVAQTSVYKSCLVPERVQTVPFKLRYPMFHTLISLEAHFQSLK